MSPKHIRPAMLVACLMALALFAAPSSTVTSANDAFDVAVRAELGPNGREVGEQVAARVQIMGGGRDPFEIAARVQIMGGGREPFNIAARVEIMGGGYTQKMGLQPTLT